MKDHTKIILTAFGLSGASALIYEVVWTRALSLVLGSTTYALSTMLTTFMAGLAVGGYLGGRLSDKRTDHLRLFGLCEAGIGVFGLLAVPLIYALPLAYLAIYRSFHLAPAVFLGVQFLLCGAIMFVPTALMGITFPLVSRAISPGPNGLGTTVGNAYAANTVGAIIGAFSAGFILLPALGIKASSFVAAALNLVLALLLIGMSGRWRKSVPVIVLAFCLAGAAAVFAEEKASFITFYTAFRFPETVSSRELVEGNKDAHRLLYYREHAEGAVRLYAEQDGSLILQTGGKIEGTKRVEMPNTLLLAYLPLASHPKAGRFLVVGLGVGVTVGAAKEYAREVDVVEINPGVVDAVRAFGPTGLLDGVNVFVDDARQHLLLHEKKYDIISSEPSYPTEASVTNLFTREFYLLARDRLNPGGIYCQWLPYYLLRDEDMAMTARTFGSVFDQVYVWKVGQTMDRIMVGSTAPFAYDHDEIVRRVQALNRSGIVLQPELSREPAQIAELARRDDIPINTDDRPLLEFHVVRNIIAGRAH